MWQARTTAEIAAAFSAANATDDATRASAIVERSRRRDQDQATDCLGYESNPNYSAHAPIAHPGFPRSRPYAYANANACDGLLHTCPSASTTYVPKISPCPTPGGQRRVEKRRPPSLPRLLRKERKGPNPKGPLVWVRG